MNAASAAPHQATGIKIGDVTDTSAIVWTRLTARDAPNDLDAPMVELDYKPQSRVAAHPRDWVVEAIRYPPGGTADDLPAAVPGSIGETRVVYRRVGGEPWTEGDWGPVWPERDYTRLIELQGLEPSTEYELRVEGRREGRAGGHVVGRLKTAPVATDPSRVRFVVSTCQDYDDRDRPDGFHIYPAMLRLDPDFFVHTGDILYYDELAKTASLARYHWHRLYVLPTLVDFHRHVPSYFMKDDHDTWRNDCWPTMRSPAMHDFTFAEGQAIFLEQTPTGPRTWRTFRWGRDLQVWLVEGRDHRDPNTMPDGPGKSIWGEEQKRWFKETFAASDATFRVLISPTPLVGPDRENKNDNHANRGFAHEGRELRSFLASQRNSIVVCGDRHWQYVSVDPATGVREYSCGPASDEHAGGWSPEDFRPDFHRFLRVKGGFLSATADRSDDAPRLTLRLHDVHGAVVFEDTLSPRDTR